MPLIKCPECNNDVSTAAETCPKCGYPIKKYIERKIDEKIEEKHPSKPVEKKKGHPILTTLIVLALIGGSIFGVVKLVDYSRSKSTNYNREVNNDGNPVLMTRSATVSDISLSQDTVATITNLKDTYALIPKVDIKGLELKITYFKSDGTQIKSVTQSVGNVSKGGTYRFSISHTLSEIWNMSKYTYSVIGGSVSYFAS